MTLRHKLFGFEGRLRRSDWWWLSIGTNLVAMALKAVAIVAVGITGVAGGMPIGFMEAFESRNGQIINFLVDVAFLWPWLALTIKRRHDRGQGGYLAAATVAFGVVLGVAGVVLTADTPLLNGVGLLAISVVVLGAAGVLVVLLGFLEGTPGLNRYGPSPKQPDATPADSFS